MLTKSEKEFIMKAFVYIFIGMSTLLLSSCNFFGEGSVEGEGRFKDMRGKSIYGYLTDNMEEYSKFIEIVDKSGLKSSLSAYNPYETGYTLFLPTNKAIDNYLANSSRFKTMEQLTSDVDFIKNLCNYHIVNAELPSKNFPFGALPKPTISGDYLTISFLMVGDSSYFKLNNKAVIKVRDIDASNGYIHQIDAVLDPIVFTTYEWLSQNPHYSIFKQAVDLTGTRSLIDFNSKIDNSVLPVTLLVEPDSVYEKMGVNNIQDLIKYVKAIDPNYTNQFNPLYNFVAYHFLITNYFLDNFVNNRSYVYNTFSEVALNIDGSGLDIAINKGKQVFDTIIYQSDTTYVDFIKFDYDASNLATQSGTVHFIDWIMTPKAPTRTKQIFQFEEEPSLVPLRRAGGTYLMTQNILKTIRWIGDELFFVHSGTEQSSANKNDYMKIEGDFTISYSLPKVVQGRYDVYLKADRFSSQNAIVEVFIDNKKVGGIVSLISGGSATSPFQKFKIGSVDFSRYIEHTVEIRALIPGIFKWDTIEFEVTK